MILKICNRDGSTKVAITNEHPSTTFPILLATDYPSKEESLLYVPLSVNEAKALIDDLNIMIYLIEKPWQKP